MQSAHVNVFLKKARFSGVTANASVENRGRSTTMIAGGGIEVEGESLREVYTLCLSLNIARPQAQETTNMSQGHRNA